MSNDTMLCGCEVQGSNGDECQYERLANAAKMAAAELRHAYRNASDGRVDLGLVSRAIRLLEEATTKETP